MGSFWAEWLLEATEPNPSQAESERQLLMVKNIFGSLESSHQTQERACMPRAG